MKKFFVTILIACSLSVTLFASSKPVVHFLGLVPGANSKMQYQLDLFDDNTYFIRTVCFKNGVAGKNNDDIGKWKQDTHNRIVLNGGREAPKYFYKLDDSTLEVMNLKGERIDSKLNYKLEISHTATTLQPRLFMHGMFRYMADAAVFKELITGRSYPVAMQDDYISLEREYLKVRDTPAQPIRIHVDGKIMMIEGMEGNKKILTLVVKKFIKINKRSVCEKPNASLENTYWKLVSLSNEAMKPVVKNKREAHLIFTNNRVKGSTGCNRIVGGKYAFNKKHLIITKNSMAMTRMLCMKSNEREFIKMLGEISTYKIVGEKLIVYDKDKIQLAKFESVYL